MIKKLLGIAPSLNKDGSFNPSPLALKLATSSKTDYKEELYLLIYNHKVLCNNKITCKPCFNLTSNVLWGRAPK